MSSNEQTPLVGGTEPPIKDDRLNAHKFAVWMHSMFPSFYGANADIDQAWNFFEHVTLPRYIMKDGEMTKVPPGMHDENKTFLYPAWTTLQKDLDDFGTGIAVYFATLRALVIICFIAGCLYIPSIIYYGSDKYSPEHVTWGSTRGSVMCSEKEWVPCPTCTLDQWWDNTERYYVDESTGLIFVLRNVCAELRWQEGVNHMVVVAFLLVAISALGWYQKHMELKYDESILTASDFSIQVDNPPDDAKDCDEWKEFFSQFGDVAYVTVALNNQDLVSQLCKRRVMYQKVAYKLNSRVQDRVPLQAIPDGADEKTRAKLQKQDDLCKELLQRNYETSAVFVTFEKEAAQRMALSKLCVGKKNVDANNVSSLESPNYLFRNSLVLDIDEAVEPSAVRWQDLDETNTYKFFVIFATSLVTMAIVAGGFFVIRSAYKEQHLGVVATSITLLNILMPHVFKFINSFEAHQTETSYQASLYCKIGAFRWINTAIITTLIKPLTVTLDDSSRGLIPAVQAVLKAEIVIAPTIHMLDIMGHIKRDLLAPFASSQPAMNNYFRGSMQFLGEKYTNMTKTVFLCFFYSLIFPMGFFYGAVSLGLIYATDKFLLLRAWRPMPELGDDIAHLSRAIFFPLACIVLVVVSEFYWSAYPFDNVCDSDQVVSADSPYVGTFTVPVYEHDTTTTLSIAGDGSESIYKYCDQNFLEQPAAVYRLLFNEERESWMSPAQNSLTFWFAVAVAIALVFKLGVYLWRDSHKPTGFVTEEVDSGQSYSDQIHINAYVTNQQAPQFSYPFLTCSDITAINANHIGWHDPVRGHDYYNLATDIDILLDGEEPTHPGLSLIKYYGPKPGVGESGASKYGSTD